MNTVKLTTEELAQAYHAVCLAIGMGSERPRDMKEATLISARNRLRKQLEIIGYFRGRA